MIIKSKNKRKRVTRLSKDATNIQEFMFFFLKNKNVKPSSSLLGDDVDVITIIKSIITGEFIRRMMMRSWLISQMTGFDFLASNFSPGLPFKVLYHGVKYYYIYIYHYYM